MRNKANFGRSLKCQVSSVKQERPQAGSSSFPTPNFKLYTSDSAEGRSCETKPISSPADARDWESGGEIPLNDGRSLVLWMAGSGHRQGSRPGRPLERGERSGEADQQSSRRVTAAPGVCRGIVPPPVILSVWKEDQHE